MDMHRRRVVSLMGGAAAASMAGRASAQAEPPKPSQIVVNHSGGSMGSAMRKAFASTGITPADVDHINAHGTSTPMGDAAECKAVRTVFGEHAARVAMSSTKALTGHGLSLAGAMEAGFCALALKRGHSFANHMRYDDSLTRAFALRHTLRHA